MIDAARWAGSVYCTVSYITTWLHMAWTVLFCEYHNRYVGLFLISNRCDEWWYCYLGTQQDLVKVYSKLWDLMSVCIVFVSHGGVWDSHTICVAKLQFFCLSLDTSHPATTQCDGLMFVCVLAAQVATSPRPTVQAPTTPARPLPLTPPSRVHHTLGKFQRWWLQRNEVIPAPF